jgi:hypothetical protein
MPRNITHKQLAQRMPSSTDACVLYRPPDDTTTTLVKVLIICNTTNAAKTYSIWVNQNGTASGDQFALKKSVSIAANTTDTLNFNDGAIVLTHSSASLIVSASVLNSITFTIYGDEIEEF